MNILVLLKQVPDTETKIAIKGDGNGIEKGTIKWILNPYDEFAIEEALKIKEAQKAGSVTVISAGPDRVVEALRTAVAMGADNAVHVKTEEEALDTFGVASALAAAVKKETFDLILTGKQAIDDDQAGTFGYVAELLDIPSASVVVKLDVGSDKKSVRVEREIEGGMKQIIDSPLPALVAVNKGINAPRYASLPGIMKAKKKEIKTLTLADLGLSGYQVKVKESGYALPPERKAGKKMSGELPAQIHELVRCLREEAKVI